MKDVCEGLLLLQKKSVRSNIISIIMEIQTHRQRNWLLAKTLAIKQIKQWCIEDSRVSKILGF